jgi:hypothetical protein
MSDLTELNELDDLINFRNQLQNDISVLGQKLRDIENKIKVRMQNEPTCCSCGRHKQIKNLIIATQEDINNYVWQNEGDVKPVIGGYYCKSGCY